MAERVEASEVRRQFNLACADTPSLPCTDDAWIGFVVGFRLYERMANQQGRAIPNEVFALVVPNRKDGE